MIRTFVLCFGFRILAIEILALKIVDVTLNTFESVIVIKSFTNYDYYKNIYLNYELYTKTNKICKDAKNLKIKYEKSI